jgi:hypothetical protein
MFLTAESVFNEKHKLYGAEKLTKDIVLADLDPDDFAALESWLLLGVLHAEGDRTGRNVFYFLTSR